MAFQYADSFEHYNSGGYNASLRNIGWTLSSTSDSYTTVSAIGGRTGLYITNGQTAYHALKSTVNARTNKIRMAFWIYIDAFPAAGSVQLLWWKDNTDNYNAGININSSGVIVINNWRGSGTGQSATTALTLSAWNHVEVEVQYATSTTTADGESKIWINGSAAGSFSGLNNNPSAVNTPALIDGFTIKAPTTSGNTYFDDILFWDDTGSDLTGHLTSTHKIETLTLVSNGTTTDWTCSSGSDYTAMLETTYNDGDSTYITTSANAKKAMATLHNPSDKPTTVYGIMLSQDWKAQSGTPSAAFDLVCNGSTTAFSNVSAPASYTSTRTFNFANQNPNTSAAWTDSDLSNGNVQWKATSSGTDTPRISAIYVEVIRSVANNGTYDVQARVTKHAAQVLSGTGYTPQARVTRQVLSVLSGYYNPQARITRQALGVLSGSGYSPQARITRQHLSVLSGRLKPFETWVTEQHVSALSGTQASIAPTTPGLVLLTRQAVHILSGTHLDGYSEAWVTEMHVSILSGRALARSKVRNKTLLTGW